MATAGDKTKKKRQRYLPQNKPVKKKGAYPLRPGVQGFFITCDGGREYQAANEALNVIDSFLEELVHGKGSEAKASGLSEIKKNKKITFSYSDEENDDADHGSDDGEREETKGEEHKEEEGNDNNKGVSEETLDASENPCEDKKVVEDINKENNKEDPIEKKNEEEEQPPAKKPCLDAKATSDKTEEKSIDKLIEAELRELGDKTKRRFMKLDPGCNGLVFIQMKGREGDPSPREIIQHMMTSAAATKKHMSRFLLRVLPIEVACYASEDEISKAIKPLVEQYFPAETESPRKFAVMYGARANTGIDRMKIINTVAKAVPAPHKVDLSNPDMTIVVEIIKTVCLIGAVEKYKELGKYNLRQLTSSN